MDTSEQRATEIMLKAQEELKKEMVSNAPVIDLDDEPTTDNTEEPAENTEELSSEEDTNVQSTEDDTQLEAEKPVEPVVAEPVEPKPDPALDTIRIQMDQLARENARLQEQLKVVEEYNGLKQLAKSDPYSTLEKLGISPNDLINQNPEDLVKRRENQEIQEYKARLERLEQEKQQEAINQAEAQYKQNLNTKLDSDKTKYPLLHAYGNIDDVYDRMNQEYIQTGKEPEVTTYFAKLEKELTDLKTKLDSAVSVTATQTTDETPKAKSSEKRTISNDDQTKPVSKPVLPENDEEKTEAKLRSKLRKQGYTAF